MTLHFAVFCGYNLTNLNGHRSTGTTCRPGRGQTACGNAKYTDYTPITRRLTPPLHNMCRDENKTGACFWGLTWFPRSRDGGGGMAKVGARGTGVPSVLGSQGHRPGGGVSGEVGRGREGAPSLGPVPGEPAFQTREVSCRTTRGFQAHSVLYGPSPPTAPTPQSLLNRNKLTSAGSEGHAGNQQHCRGEKLGV